MCDCEALAETSLLIRKVTLWSKATIHLGPTKHKQYATKYSNLWTYESCWKPVWSCFLWTNTRSCPIKHTFLDIRETCLNNGRMNNSPQVQPLLVHMILTRDPPILLCLWVPQVLHHWPLTWDPLFFVSKFLSFILITSSLSHGSASAFSKSTQSYKTMVELAIVSMLQLHEIW